MKIRFSYPNLKIYNRNYGYTLIEFLIGTAILGIIGIVVVSILFTTFRISKKTTRINELRQIGSTVSSQVIKNVRFAKSLDDPVSCIGGITTSNIKITSVVDNFQTIYSCDPSNNGVIIASNGASLIDQRSVVLTECSFICSQSTFDESPTINFKFNIISVTGGILDSDLESIPFNASVSLRN